MGDHPVNVAVCGDYLEKLHFKRDFLKFNGNNLLELFVSPCDFWSCKFSCDGEGWQRQARVWTSSNPLILLSDVRLACPPRRSDHRKIYRRRFFVDGYIAVLFRLWNIHIPTTLSKFKNFIIKEIEKTHFNFLESVIFIKMTS